MKINDWKPETRSLLEALQKAGCTLTGGNNGEYRFTFRNMSQFIKELTACDESNLDVICPDGKTASLFLVYGNEPGVLVCDYSVHPVLDAVTEAHYNAWAGRKQPTMER
jgi:hypothetical protein